MADEGYLLTYEDALALQRLLGRERARLGNAANRPQPPWPPDPSPECFIVRAPVGGIPAMGFERTPGAGYTGTGSGTCKVYEPVGVLCDVYQVLFKDNPLQTPQLWPVYFDQLVYNLSNAAVSQGGWALAHRERFGDWFCEGAAGGGEGPNEGSTGTGSFGYHEYRTDCIDGVNVRYKRLVSVLDPLGQSHLGGWVFDSYQGVCFFEGDTGTGTGTGHFAFTEYKTECERGVNVRYKRTVTVSDPLIGSNTTAWAFDSFQGNCDFPATGTSTGSFPFYEYKTDCIEGVNVRYKQLVNVADHVRRSRLGGWAFDSYQGNCDFPGTGTGTNCRPIVVWEEQARCEANVLNIYRRSNTVNVVHGCPTLSTSSWALNRSEGICGLPTCSGVYTYEEQVRCEVNVLNVYQRRNTLNVVGGCLTLVTSAWQFAREEGCCDCGDHPGTGTGTHVGTGTGTGTDVRIGTPCFTLPMPQTVHATFSGGSGTCACVNSIPSFPMFFLPTFMAPYNWDGDFTDACSGGASVLHLACTSGTWQLHCDGGFGSLAFPNVTASSASWNGVTLSIVFTVSIISPCNGSFTVTITL